MLQIHMYKYFQIFYKCSVVLIVVGLFFNPPPYSISHMIDMSRLEIHILTLAILCFQVKLDEMYAQMVYKDRKIMELNNKILDTEKHLMDLQEHIQEKDEVIRSKDKAIQVNTCQCISRKDKAIQVNKCELASSKVQAIQVNTCLCISSKDKAIQINTCQCISSKDKDIQVLLMYFQQGQGYTGIVNVFPARPRLYR